MKKYFLILLICISFLFPKPTFAQLPECEINASCWSSFNQSLIDNYGARACNKSGVTQTCCARGFQAELASDGTVKCILSRSDDFDATETLTQDQLNTLNPLFAEGNNLAAAIQLLTPRGIISRVLTFAFPIAGLILFIMIIWGGFETIGQAGSKKSIDAGKQRINNSLIGFILLFSAYWIVQILEIMFNISIL